MAPVRRFLLVMVGLTAAASTFDPVQATDSMHPYDCGCNEDLVPGEWGLFLPSLLIALVAAVGLHRAGGSTRPPLPPAQLVDASTRSPLRSAFANGGARLAAHASIGCRVAAYAGLALALGMLLFGLEGPGRWPFVLTHVTLFLAVEYRRDQSSRLAARS